MKRTIIIYLLTFFFSISGSYSQLFSKKDKGGDFKFSDYKPAKDRKNDRKIKKQIKEQQASSYKPKKQKLLASGPDSKESKNNKLRLKRSRDDGNRKKNKEAKITSKKAYKYQSKANKNRNKQIAYNKKNYGTKTTRKAAETHKSERHILNADKKSTPRSRKNA